MSDDPGAELLRSAAVRRWLAHTGYETEAGRRRCLELLGGFCVDTGQAPEELVASCFRITKDGDRKISIKGRRAMQEAIESFIAKRGETGHAAVAAGNVLRSFLIHNGVFMQGRASID
jgi:hypothetical protein